MSDETLWWWMGAIFGVPEVQSALRTRPSAQWVLSDDDAMRILALDEWWQASL